MMKRAILMLAALAVVHVAVGQAKAGIITFNSQPDFTYWLTPINSEGFKFSDITGEGSLGTARNLDGSSVDNGTVHLMDWVNGGSLSALRMEASDNSLFSLSSFDFTSGYLNGTGKANQLTVTGYDISGNVVANAAFTSTAYSNLSFTTLNLSGSFQNLRYVTFEALGNGNRVGYDNIVVNASAAVPEPSSLALFGMATATFAGYFGWRRRKSPVNA